MHRNARIVAALAAATMLLPSAALAKSQPIGKPLKPATPGSDPARYIFKGTWHIDGTVTVSGGNSRVRTGGYYGQIVGFDLTGAKLVAADTNGDGAITIADLAEGDKVVVKAWLPRTAPGPGPFPASMLVDQTR
jgi:hypothetical protein